MRVLITGVAGFIGSHLAERFLEEGFYVIGMDNFLTGSPDNIAHLFEKKNFRFIHYNVVNYIYVEGPVDLVVHLACPASPVDYMNHPIHTMKVDSLGTLNTLGFAKLKGSRYVFASSSEVYGSAQVHPQPEDYWGYVNPVGPRSVYDEAKRFSEALCMAYHREHGLDVRIARIFNTYGPRMRRNDGRVIPTFIEKALRGEPLPIYGDGSQTRSFCYIDDLVDGLFRLSVEEGLAGTVVNLGNPEEVSILELAQKVIELSESSSKIEFLPPRDDDPPRRCPDISRAKKLLGWFPQISFEEGLKITFRWFVGL
ncbi:UDP-glucuronic acid decarboxylase family protein [Pampinifervens florentissimum]|uniref:UDP-glucuronic acid decarboxylase family protein n=1 Tax=Pampinifervens florentissimum TaxID=1632019 RepID=UPI0013B49CC2|nr:UDP-glucuronic acid decarboxylase family protein [Hydrogenobacter sp. T-8]QID33625.1 SDR family oxidoreductase [Hydrogenobacter sp. T-8]